MKMILRKTPIFALLISLLFFISCDDDTDSLTPETEVEEEIEEEEMESVPIVLIESTQLIIKSSGDLQTFLKQSGLAIDTEKLIYNVSVWRVTYKTVYKGDTITASTMVFTPETTDEVSTISFQHGTIADNASAPTEAGINDGSIILYSAIASGGFVTVVPDFVGFGASVEFVHPYYHEYYTATSIVNAIYASKQLVESHALNIDNDLYLAGYSQGGYATMAAHKYFEEEGMDFYDLKASFPSSGGYDVSGMSNYFLGQETYHQPFFLGFVAMSYKTSYDFAETMGHFFNEPYATEIPEMFFGSFSGDQINERLTTNISDFLTEGFLNSSAGDADYAFIYDLFEDNSLLDWTPTIRMYMYHGDADITVPYQNSVDSYAKLLGNGASESIVTFETFSGATHGTGVGPYIESFIPEILNLEKR
ncbi:MAG: pimeloyl-ACP methyl ester carboxylesterase [Cyclobacteriaceae bacterium]|jgi:pimeloyl-ACP methyl ester carboxylesterase